MVRFRRRLFSVGLVLAASAGLGCDVATEASAMQKPTRVATRTTAPSAVTPATPAPPPLAAGQVVAIPVGTLLVGSIPGTPDRDPSREADHVSISLGAFSIDRLPYPNDPALPLLTNVTRAEAAQKCTDGGKRLCSEFEWERACKGNEGVSDLGTRSREWTSSDAPNGIGVNTRTAVTRGGTIPSASDTPPATHRCPARNAATPESRSESIGFRCCSGDSAPVAYPTEPARALIQGLELSTDALRAKLKTVPELARYADTFVPLTQTDISHALSRGDRGVDSITLWTIAPPVFTWSPMSGEEILVITGSVNVDAREATLLAALYPHDGKLIHGASTLLRDKESSVAIGTREDAPTSLLWTSCWGCFGEGGRLSLGTDNRVSLQFH